MRAAQGCIPRLHEANQNICEVLRAFKSLAEQVDDAKVKD